MNAAELRSKSEEELNDELVALRREQFNLRMQQATGEMAQVHEHSRVPVEYWVCQVQPGRVLYEMEGVTEEVAREAFRLAAAKLPFGTTFVTRQVM